MDENGYGGNGQYDNQQSGGSYGQQLEGGYGQTYDDKQYGDSYKQQYGSLREHIPEGLMERLPGQLRDRLDDAIDEADRKNENFYERVEPDILKTKMNPAVAIIAVVIGFGGTIIFAKINPVISLLCFGIMFLILGIGIVVDKNFNFCKNSVSTLVLFIGAYIVLVSGYTLLTRYIPSLPEMKGKLMVIAVGTGFTLFGVFFFILSCIAVFYEKRVCSERLQAVCVHIKEKRVYKDGRSRTEYAPVFEFRFLSKTYYVAEDYGVGDVPLVGSSCELFINPYNPKEFYRKDINPLVFIGPMCAVFILFGCLICYFG